MRYQLELFFTALMFYTRIPTPKWVPYSKQHLQDASQYLPLVGWVIGGIGAGIFMLANQLFPISVAVILSTIATILATGAFHEDGFADVCDGFGGGWEKDRVLEIMKDSSVGAFGAIGIFLLLALKLTTLATIPVELLPFIIFVAHPLSRFAAVSLMFTHDYARKTKDSKSEKLARQMGWQGLTVSTLFGLLPLILLPLKFLWLILPVFILRLLMSAYFQKRIGGYTGDCAGAVQQVTEVGAYLGVLAVSSLVIG